MRAISLLFAACSLMLLPAADAAAQAAQTGPAYECKAGKSNVTTCKRPVSADAKKQCHWKCRKECGGEGPGRQCTETCRGSGQECNGKSPPGW